MGTFLICLIYALGFWFIPKVVELKHEETLLRKEGK